MDKKELVDSLACSQGRRDQEPNKALAEIISSGGDAASVKLLVDIARNAASRTANDALHTLSFIAEEEPGLVSPFIEVLLPGLASKNNRTVWATMILLSHLVEGNEPLLYSHLPEILSAMEKGSVITRDHGIRILIKLYSVESYREDAFLLYLEQLTIAPDNQVGQYVERILPVLRKSDRPGVIDVLTQRMQEFTHDSHIRRAARLIRSFQQ